MRKTFVSSDRHSIAQRCGEIRERLDDFANDRLGPMATGEVRGHLLGCQACSEVFGEQLLEAVERGEIPLMTPPSVPPIELLERYLLGPADPSWKVVRARLHDVDAKAREWAARRMEEIRVGFQQLVAPPVLTRGAIRTRGAVRGRGSPPPATMRAKVMAPGGASTATVVAFDVRTPPGITADGRFTLEMWTDASKYDGRRLVCTIALPSTEPLSFEGTVTPVEGEARRRVLIEEASVPGPALLIPMDAVTLAID